MEIKPFKAYRYNKAVVGDVGSCIAPPYDVIGDDEQEALYQKSAYNIVRVIKGKTTPTDDGRANQYTRAADQLSQWIRQGALKEDDKEAIYAYVQDFEIAGQAFQRLTFIALARLEDFGKTVKPHEQIFEKPMLDRLNLKKATAARFGLVFMMYEDPQEIADKIIRKAATTEALVDFVDEQDVRHRLFTIEADEDINAIVRMMAEKSCIIADGHHRYTTGLNYSRQSDNPAAKYQMLAFTNLRQKGLVVLATHRLVGGLENVDPQGFLMRLSAGFTVSKFAYQDNEEYKEAALQNVLGAMKSIHEQDETALSIYMGDGNFYLLVLKDKSLMAAAASERSEAWRSLDVSVLQKLVLEDLLDIGEARMGDPNYVQYVKDRPNAIHEMIDAVDAGRKQIAFFTNPVKMQQLVKVTDAGERMPQKSTYFYPKMYTGLTIQKL
jgi:uncharacterized protein (DUF1015 family)